MKHQKKEHRMKILWKLFICKNKSDALSSHPGVCISCNSHLLKLCVLQLVLSIFECTKALLTQLLLITRTVQTYSNQKSVVILVYS